MFELMVAAKMFLTAPQSIVGTDRAKIQTQFGRPESVGTDYRTLAAPAEARDSVITLDWPQLRIRLYVASDRKTISLLGVTTTSDALGIASPVHIGVDRGTVLRELGGPAYEDEQQIIYSLQEEDPDLPNQTVRLVFKDDRVAGIDWTYPVDR